MQIVTPEEQERVAQAWIDFHKLCKKHGVEFRANEENKFWFECIEYEEPEPPNLKIVS